MITPDQIRAARALKNWSQAELAERAGVATPSIANIELGKQKPSAQMLDKIYEAFLAGGIEFTKTGVQKKTLDERINVISQNEMEGKNIFLTMLEDIYITLKDADEAEKEVLWCCILDEVTPPDANNLLRKIRKAGIRFRNLICEGDTYIMGDLSEYRYMPKSLFINSTSMIYGSKYVVFLDSSVEKPEPSVVIVIDDINAATAQKGLFEILWQSLPMPQKTTAKERY